jgi:hypothetical protein
MKPLQQDLITPKSSAFLDEITRRLSKDRRPWFATADVAALFDVNSDTVLAWIEEGRVAATNLNAERLDPAGQPFRPYWRIMRADVECFAARLARGV